MSVWVWVWVWVLTSSVWSLEPYLSPAFPASTLSEAIPFFSFSVHDYFPYLLVSFYLLMSLLSFFQCISLNNLLILTCLCTDLTILPSSHLYSPSLLLPLLSYLILSYHISSSYYFLSSSHFISLISIVFRAFLTGFREMIPVDWMRMFSAKELQLLISGDQR